jgi:aldehyde:ferredoxin oxidoreductase
MSGGYVGKILRVNLSTGAISTINTSDYADKFGGGHGIGSAIFWDLAVKPGNWDLLDGFDERNVVTIMASPLCGTPTVGAGGRTEIQGVGVHAYMQEHPNTGWFTRSNHGGRFSAELKYAGWDGVVI